MEDEQSTEAAAEGGGDEDPKPDTDDEKEEADDHDQQLRKGGPEADLGYHPGGSKKKSPRRTDHTYRDFSKYPADHIPTDRRTQNNFPAKLHQILSTPAYSHVSVNPHLRLLFLSFLTHSRSIGPSEPPNLWHVNGKSAHCIVVKT